jgi:predicted nucleotidyltransferase
MHLSVDQRADLGRILARNLPASVRVFAFGSRVHGRNLKPYSDLDLCLRDDQPVPSSVQARAALSAEFRDAIARDLEPFVRAHETADCVTRLSLPSKAERELFRGDHVG